MPLLVWIIIFCLLGGLLSVLAAALFLVLSEPLRNHVLPHLVSFATGTLLGAAFLGLLPHALGTVAGNDVHIIPMTVLLGLLGFFTAFEFDGVSGEIMPQFRNRFQEPLARKTFSPDASTRADVEATNASADRPAVRYRSPNS